jgi:hypothetical protein
VTKRQDKQMIRTMAQAMRDVERTTGKKLRCYRYRGVMIPVCWSAAIYGPDRCTCPTAADLEREYQSWKTEYRR